MIGQVAAVMIGVDPRKGSRTAAAIDQAERALGELRVRTSATQAERLVAWPAGWPERIWVVERAGVLCRHRRRGTRRATALGPAG